MRSEHDQVTKMLKDSDENPYGGASFSWETARTNPGRRASGARARGQWFFGFLDRWSNRLHWRLIGTAVATVVVHMGCSLNSVGRNEVGDALARQAREASAVARRYATIPVLDRSSGVSHDQAATTAEVDESPSRPEPATPIRAEPATLRDFIACALEQNVEIKAAEELARAKAERIPQVTALPDPILNTKAFPEPVRTAEGDSFFILGVSQKLPAPEKLDRRGRIALEETRISLERLQQTRLRVIADVKRAYFQLYVVDKSIEVTQSNQDLLRGLINVARAQVAAGRRRQDDVLRAQTEMSNLEAELIVLRQRRVTVAAKLNELLSRDRTRTVETPQDFDIRRAQPAIETLLARAIEVNPELRIFARQIERNQWAVELAKLAYRPDFIIGFEWMQMNPRGAFKAPVNPTTGQRPVTGQLSEDGSDNWAITLGFNLPIWVGKIKAGIEEANRKLSATRQQFAAARNRVFFQVEDALERVRAQQALASLFKDTIIPQAEQTYRVSQASYTAGASDFLYVIDNWQKWLVFTIQYYRSLGELERSVADLEQALGISLAELRTP